MILSQVSLWRSDSDTAAPVSNKKGEETEKEEVRGVDVLKVHLIRTGTLF